MAPPLCRKESFRAPTAPQKNSRRADSHPFNRRVFSRRRPPSRKKIPFSPRRLLFRGPAAENSPFSGKLCRILACVPDGRGIPARQTRRPSQTTPPARRGSATPASRCRLFRATPFPPQLPLPPKNPPRAAPSRSAAPLPSRFPRRRQCPAHAARKTLALQGKIG